MKKTTLLIMLLIALSQFTFAQKIGAKVGLNLAGVNTNFSGTFTNKTGINGSVFVEKELFPMLSIRPEIGYSQLGYKSSNILNTENTQYLDYIQLSMDLRIKPPVLPLYVVAGPYAGYAFSGKYKIDNVSFDTEFGKDHVLAYDFGVNAGIGYVQNLAIMKLFIECRYELGLVDYDDSWQNYYLKNKNISIASGIMF